MEFTAFIKPIDQYCFSLVALTLLSLISEKIENGNVIGITSTAQWRHMEKRREFSCKIPRLWQQISVQQAAAFAPNKRNWTKEEEEEEEEEKKRSSI